MKNLKVQSTLILIATFVLGMMTGILIYRSAFQYKVKQFSRMRTPQGFMHSLELIIEPTAEQTERVKEILTRYARRFSEMHLSPQQNPFLQLMRSMQQELARILTPEQLQRIRRRFMGPPRFMNRRKPGTFPRGGFNP